MQLLQSIAEAIQNVAESLQSVQSASSSTSDSCLAWLFGIGSSIDYNASRLAASFVTHLFCCRSCGMVLLTDRKLGRFCGIAPAA